MVIKWASVMKDLCLEELLPSSLAAKHWWFCPWGQRGQGLLLRAPHLCRVNCSLTHPWIFCVCRSEINYSFHQCKSSAIWRAFGRFVRPSGNCKDELFSCLAGESFYDLGGFVWAELCLAAWAGQPGRRQCCAFSVPFCLRAPGWESRRRWEAGHCCPTRPDFKVVGSKGKILISKHFCVKPASSSA